MFLRNSWASYPTMSRSVDLEKDGYPENCIQYTRNNEEVTSLYSPTRDQEQRTTSIYQSQKFGCGYFRPLGPSSAHTWNGAVPFPSMFPDICESDFNFLSVIVTNRFYCFSTSEYVITFFSKLL